MSGQPTNPNGRRGRLVAINRSDGGVPKKQVSEARITASGLEGDRQANPQLHGGADRAITLFSLEAIEALAREGHPIAIGSVGENLTVSQLDWTLIVPGAELQVGAVRLRITKYAKPCSKIRETFLNEDQSRVSPDANPGWSRVCARVLEEGTVRVGDAVLVL